MTFAQLQVGVRFVFASSPSLENIKLKRSWRSWTFADYVSHVIPLIVGIGSREGDEVIPLSTPLGDADTPSFDRAGGDARCELCGLRYFNHPYSQHRDYQDRPWLKRACDGRLLKL